MKTLKKGIALLLVLAMSLSMMSLSVFAEDVVDTPSDNVETVEVATEPETPAVEEQAEPAEEAEEATEAAEPTAEPEEVTEAAEPAEEAEEETDEVEPAAEVEEETEAVESEEDAEEVEEEKVEEKQEEPKPAQPELYPEINSIFSAAAGGYKVTVMVPAGSFAEDFTFRVFDPQLTAEEKAALGFAADDAVLDIGFENADGVEIEPVEGSQINVAINIAEAEAEAVEVYHVENDEAVLVAESDGDVAKFDVGSFSLFIVKAAAATVSVTYDGAKYSTIADAVAAAIAHDDSEPVIHVGTGTYDLPATTVLPAGTTLEGEGAASTTFRITTENDDGVKITNPNVTIQNATIDGSAITSGGHKSLINVKADGVKIDSVVMTGGGMSTWNSSIRVESLTATQTFTVKNSTISGSFRGVLRESCNANIVIQYCDIDAVYPFNIDGGSGGTVTVTGGALHGWTSYSCVDSVTFTNVAFSKANSGYDIVAAYENTTFTNCSFDKDFEPYSNGKTPVWAFTNCTRDGSSLTAESFGAFTSLFANEYRSLRAGITCTVNSVSVAYSTDNGKWTNPVAKVSGEPVIYYASLAAAVAAVQDGETITLLKDLTGLTTTLELHPNVSVVFDGNGHTISGAYQYPIVEFGGKITEVKNLHVVNGDGSLEKVASYCLAVSQATVTLRNVTADAYPGMAFVATDGANVTLYDCTFTSHTLDGGLKATGNSSWLGSALMTQYNATVTVESGAYTTQCVGGAAYIASSGGYLTINGGTFTGKNAVVNDGVKTNFSSYNDLLTINGGTFYGNIWAGNYCMNGTLSHPALLTITDGNFFGYESNALKLYANNNAVVTIYGGKFDTFNVSFNDFTDSPGTGSHLTDTTALIITGGTYGNRPNDDYVATGYAAVPSDASGDVTSGGDHWTVVRQYTVKFVDDSGKLLKSILVTPGTTPSYGDTTPTKAADTSNTYTFSGWTPALAAATGNATYTATFTATPVANSNVVVTVSDDGNIVTVTDSDGNSTKTTTNSTTGDAGALNFAPETKTSTVETIAGDVTTSATVTKTVEDLTYDGDSSTYTYTVKTATATDSTAEAAASAVETALSDSPDTSTTVRLKAEKANATVETTKADIAKDTELETTLTAVANNAAQNVITTDKVLDSALSEKMTTLAEENEVTGKNVTVDVTLTLETKLTDYTVESAEATSVTFDVKPVMTTVVKIDGVQQGEAESEVVANDKLADSITVRLPVPASFIPGDYEAGTTTIQIKHIGDDGTIEYVTGTISGNAGSGYYVTFEVTHFSSFELVPAGKVFVTFDANGGVGGTTLSLTPGADVTVPTVTRSGYTFAGWDKPVDAAAGAESVTYTAQWNAIVITPDDGGIVVPTGGNNSGEVEITDEETPLSDLPIFYVDVATGDWFRDAVAYVTNLGLMNGVGDQHFDPNSSTTRGMVATILMRMAKGEAVDLESFDDVANDAYYAEAAAWAVENDVFNGYEDSTFRGETVITREQLATVLYRYALSKGFKTDGSVSLDAYADGGKVSGYATEAMKWALANGILKGVSETEIDPTGAATRAQLATIMMRFNELTSDTL